MELMAKPYWWPVIMGHPVKFKESKLIELGETDE